MKLYKYLLSASIVAISAAMVSCDDDDIFTVDNQQCFILGSSDLDCPKVEGRSGIIWKSRISNDTIYLKISPSVDPAEELDSVSIKLYVSKGATVSPDPSIPQNFAKEGGVKYTVTSGDGKTTRTYVVTHGLTDIVEYGDGFTRGATSSPSEFTSFTNLGYPGELNNFNLGDSRQYGDLNGYVAFCGHDHFVILAGQYTYPKFDNAALAVPDETLALKVFKYSDFSPVGNLNTGSVPYTSFRAVTSDINGVLVAGVALDGGGADFYYWKSYTDAPTKLAHFSETMFANRDGADYLQVTGDIFGACNICTNATRGPEGLHYMIHMENGAVSDIQTVSTGYSSSDGNGWQMISAITPELHSSYVVGDTDKTIADGNGNNTLRVCANTYSGKTKVNMPVVLQTWNSWWVGTGSMHNRTGARRPFVSAMNINGKHYVALQLGTGWWFHNDIVELDDLSTRVVGTEIKYAVNNGWSFGASCDWYWDPDKKEGFTIYYTERSGVCSSRLTCYE